jgi:hypothetical protein
MHVTHGKPIRWTLADCQAHAKELGGQCLAQIYKNNVTPMEWECHRGHRWKARWGHMTDKSAWCPRCHHLKLSVYLRMDGLAQAHELAKKRGGRCLSKRYRNNQQPLLWECQLGHRWRTDLNHVKGRGSWCPVCAWEPRSASQRMDGLAIALKVATERGGRCLSTNYRNSHSKLKWKCERGHQWEATLNNVSRLGSWCPVCGMTRSTSRLREYWLRSKDAVAKRFASLYLERARRLAAERGGECLADSVSNRRSPLYLRCKFGHTWKSNLAKLSNGRWCRECGRARSERIVRIFFETILGEKFPPVWPDWLRTKAGHRMQLDGYCERLQLAFEHQGKQHSRPVKLFGGRKALLERQARDRRKRKLCARQRIRLIEVPALDEELPIEKLQSWIVKACRRRGLSLPTNADRVPVDFSRSFLGEWDRQLEEVRAVATSRGGKCLSKAYLGSQIKLRFECAKGHVWKAAPAVIKQGGWCRICSIAGRSGDNHYLRRNRTRVAASVPQRES